jgi:hypothetical protein
MVLDKVSDGVGAVGNKLSDLTSHGLEDAGITGTRWSVKHLQTHCQIDLCVSLGIFVISNGVTAVFTPYWRPVFWDIFWIVLAVLIGALGLYGCRKKYSFVILAFIFGVVMLGCVNIAHLMALHSEHVRTCNLSQNSFMGCSTEPTLQHCLVGDNCLRAEIQATKTCNAPGKEHCEALDSIGYAFAINIMISFLTFAEPAYWTGIYLIRLEMSYPLTPDEKDEDKAAKDEAEPLLQGNETKQAKKSCQYGSHNA